MSETLDECDGVTTCALFGWLGVIISQLAQLILEGSVQAWEVEAHQSLLAGDPTNSDRCIERRGSHHFLHRHATWSSGYPYINLRSPEFCLWCNSSHLAVGNIDHSGHPLREEHICIQSIYTSDPGIFHWDMIGDTYSNVSLFPTAKLKSDASGVHDKATWHSMYSIRRQRPESKPMGNHEVSS